MITPQVIHTCTRKEHILKSEHVQVHVHVHCNMYTCTCTGTGRLTWSGVAMCPPEAGGEEGRASTVGGGEGWGMMGEGSGREEVSGEGLGGVGRPASGNGSSSSSGM